MTGAGVLVFIDIEAIAAGESATPDAPIAWLRMEPAGEMADLRLQLWPGGDDEVLADVGYHGRPIRWRA